ncbi:MAG: hypothetical protein IPK91_02590 [Saprospiraceae bacterium]|nr:hypothetical protein [Saprospiraceae bacterium]MBK8296177.1 hypothetical protein [Saprospiraceae bacterium]
MKKLILVFFGILSINFAKTQPSNSQIDTFVDVIYDINWYLGDNCIDNLNANDWPDNLHFRLYLWNCLSTLAGYSSDTSNHLFHPNNISEFNAWMDRMFEIYYLLQTAGQLDTDEEKLAFLEDFFDKYIVKINSQEELDIPPQGLNPCTDKCHDDALDSSLLCLLSCAGGPAACWYGVACIIVEARKYDRCIDACFGR